MASDLRTVPVVGNVAFGGTATEPRVSAVLSNASGATLTDVQVVAMVRDRQGDVIAASQTIVPAIPAQGQATALFTWNGAFAGVPVSIGVMPIIPLSP